MNKKLVVVTGAAGGLGCALVRAYLSRGYSVLALVRGAVNGPLAELVSHGDLYVLEVDVNSVQAPSIFSEKIKSLMEVGMSLDTCIFNAGVLARLAVEEVNTELVSCVLETNFLSVLNLLQSILPVFNKQGFGSILAVSSLSAHIGLPGDGIYAASKAALERLFESLSLELSPQGISVGVLIPSSFPSGLFRGDGELGYQSSGALSAKDRCGERAVFALAEKAVNFVESGMPGFRLPGDERAKTILAQLYRAEGVERQALANTWCD